MVVLLLAMTVGGAVITPARAQVPSGTPACLDTDANGQVDNDGDGLCDNWEDSGIDVDRDGTVDLHLYDLDQDGMIAASERVNKNRKDLFLELDFMPPHRPLPDAVNDVIAAFAAAPVANPDGSTGITLRIRVDDEIPFSETAVTLGESVPNPDACPPESTLGYCNLKRANYGTARERANPKALQAKRFVSRYGIQAHLAGGEALGEAATPGDDLVLAYGGLGDGPEVAGRKVGSRSVQSGTFMHEFGHNLGLPHGGSDSINCKPNYLSVLNYNYQVEDVPGIRRPLDFSRSALPDLNEAALDERVGIQGPAGRETPYGPDPLMTAAADGPIDWNRNGVIDPGPVTADINSGPSCDAGSSAATLLKGGEDWTRIQYGTEFAKTVITGGAGEPGPVNARRTHVDLTPAQLEAMSPDTDGDGVINLYDNCVYVSNADQSDNDADALGNMCDGPFDLAPVVSAGPDLVGRLGQRLNLVGRVVDANLSDLDVFWSVASMTPSTGALCDIDRPDSVTTAMVCARPGSYEVRLSATDGITSWVSDTAIVRILGDSPGAGAGSAFGLSVTGTPSLVPQPSVGCPPGGDQVAAAVVAGSISARGARATCSTSRDGTVRASASVATFEMPGLRVEGLRTSCATGANRGESSVSLLNRQHVGSTSRTITVVGVGQVVLNEEVVEAGGSVRRTAMRVRMANGNEIIVASCRTDGG